MNTLILLAAITLSAFAPPAGVAMFCWWLWRLEHRKT